MGIDGRWDWKGQPKSQNKYSQMVGVWEMELHTGTRNMPDQDQRVQVEGGEE